MTSANTHPIDQEKDPVTTKHPMPGDAHGNADNPDDLREPVCGMRVTADSPHQLLHAGTNLKFCSTRCLEKFRATAAYLDADMEHHPQESETGLPAQAKYAAEVNSTSPPRYTCPMHPEIVQDSPGECPKCGMALEPMMASTDDDELQLGVDGDECIATQPGGDLMRDPAHLEYVKFRPGIRDFRSLA